MSRIGKKIIHIPEGITVKLEKGMLEIKGPKGTLNLEIHREIEAIVRNKEIFFQIKNPSKKSMALWGLTRTLVNNMLIGVTEGYQKNLELQGVGFRISLQGKKLILALGFSHLVEIEIPQGLEVKLGEKNTLMVSGIDKKMVGQFTVDLRELKKAEPYKGKGFRYVGEYVRRKVGKKAAAAVK
ncbi:MAG: 50S ribosomal protein L6 [Candidatus Moranbacteria bacterium CG06_land_8_20_14_3_00_40_12]|nr:MAG: 50S ribosomal protein L6 [Candidatus Moranbacteria bacterium CG23_combo_of_CG06-09_8_20_14_all_40_16]PIU80697.1 MAG: 50S ribosomal protein L6 [Candidatus Moranbacteria bacterium CG06_land_8_20_14_3_00_40_12]